MIAVEPERHELSQCEKQLLARSVDKCIEEEAYHDYLWKRLDAFHVIFKTLKPFIVNCTNEQLLVEIPQGIIQLEKNCKVRSDEYQYTTPNDLWTTRHIINPLREATDFHPVSIKRVKLELVDEKSFRDRFSSWDDINHPYTYLTSSTVLLTLLLIILIAQKIRVRQRQKIRVNQSQKRGPGTPFSEPRWAFLNFVGVENGESSHNTELNSASIDKVTN